MTYSIATEPNCHSIAV